MRPRFNFWLSRLDIYVINGDKHQIPSGGDLSDIALFNEGHPTGSLFLLIESLYTQRPLSLFEFVE